MKNIIKKTVISLILVVTLICILDSMFKASECKAMNLVDEMGNLASNETILGGILDGLVGIVLYIPKATVFGVIQLLRLLIGGITSLGGDSVWTVDGIIFTGSRKEGFTGVNLVSIDFFNFNSGNNTVNELRKSIATWYYALRNLSIVILLGILLYVGIRMAISTVAADEAKYKKMFKDWVVSLALIFVLHYIMIFTIEINNTLVTLIHGAVESQDSLWTTAMDQIGEQVWNVSFSVGVGSLVVYIMLVGVTIVYLFSYIKRMLTVGFLIIIAPLITITYSIDTIGDGKPQALNAWLKEFVFNILIQPFHCIIYVVFVNTAVKLMTDGASLSSSVLAVVMMLFMNKAEDIVKQIFHFQSSSLPKALGHAAAITTGMSILQNRGEKSAKKNGGTGKIPDMNSKEKGGSGSSGSSGGSSGSSTGASRSQSNNAANNMEEANNSDNHNSSSGSGGEQTGENQTHNQNSSQNKQPESWWTRDINKEFFNDAGRNIANTAKTIPGRLKNAGKRMLKATPGAIAKGATYLTLAALGSAAGAGGITAGLHAAGALNKAASAKYSKSSANKMVKQNEEKFAEEYKNFQASKNWSDEKMAGFTEQLMDGNVDVRSLDDEEAEYYSYVRKMQQTYKAVGEEDVHDRMLNTIDMINSGDISVTSGTEQSEPPKPKPKTKPKPKKS